MGAGTCDKTSIAVSKTQRLVLLHKRNEWRTHSLFYAVQINFLEFWGDILSFWIQRARNLFGSDTLELSIKSTPDSKLS